MGIRMTTNMGDMEAYIKRQTEKRIQAVIYRLNNIGVQCVNEAKTGRTYTPRTQALLNSTGYAIVRDGIIVSGTNFQGKSGSIGEQKIKELALKYPKGIALIVVAGMNYAAYVEAKGFNVLTSAELLAEKLVPEMLKELGIK
jgi:hypothetical protein